MRRFSIIACSVLCLAATFISAQSVRNTGAAARAKEDAAGPGETPRGLGTVTGTVRDAGTKEPLPGAAIAILGKELGANTDADGKYVIANVPPETYSLQAKMMGYTTVTITDIRVKRGYTVVVDFNLNAKALETSEIVIKSTKKNTTADAATKTTVVNATPAPATSAVGATSGIVTVPPEPAKPSTEGAPSGRKPTDDKVPTGSTGGAYDDVPKATDSGITPPELISTGEPPSYPSIARKESKLDDRSSEAPRKEYSTKTVKPASPGMQAGSNDDNKQFNYYLGYLERFKHIQAKKLDITGRVVFTASDADGRPVAGCPLVIKDGAGKVLARRTTYADGRAMFFTTEQPAYEKQDLVVEATLGQEKLSERFSHNGRSLVDLKFTGRRPTYNNVPVDVVFLLDCTGSMGDEIARLKQTLQVIQFQISQLPSKPAVRFGMVQYRDRGDEYITRSTPFTADVDRFQRSLDSVQAGGGGDEPEDVQAGLKLAVREMAWRATACKLVFLVADAPPHLYDDESFTYVDAMRESAQQAIKIITVGASGLNDQGEYVFRQLSQYTMGQFVFLTYGETGEVSGGGTARVSHHTGTNFQTENLDAIIVRIIKQELANYGDGTIEKEPEYFETNVTAGADKDGVLKELFAEGIRQLLDYSIVRIDSLTPAAVMPVTFGDEALRAKAEALEDKIVLNLAPVRAFRLVERKDLRQIMEEQKLSLTGAFDDAHTIEVGKLVGAKILILPKLHKGKDKLELYLKLVKVETGEIMSITLLKLDEGLL